MGWGAVDRKAMVQLIQENHPELKVVLVSHGIGGQVMGFNPLNTAFEKVIMAAWQSGCWKIYSGWTRLGLSLFWYFFIPGFTPIFGYYPGKIIGIVDNLPKNMVLEWRKRGIKKESFRHFYTKVERIHFDKGYNGKRPGHFGFFKEEFKKEFWERTLDWLTI